MPVESRNVQQIVPSPASTTRLVVESYVPQRLYWIEGLRGIAVMAVVLQHLVAERFQSNLYGIRAFIDPGIFGVIVFFCISGFIIPHSILGLRDNPVLSFPIARFFRLYPAYWISLMLGAIIFHPHIIDVLWNITMTQRFVGRRDVIGVYWTLQVELIFYAIFELLLVARKVSVKSVYPALTITFAVLSIAMGAGRFYLDRRMPLALTSGLTIMFLATTYFMHLNHGLFSRPGMVLFAAAVFAFLFIAFHLGYSKDWGFQETPQRFYAMYLLAPVTFLAFQALHLRNAALDFLGTISYSIYLFHIPVIGMASALFAGLGIPASSLISVLCVILVATLAYHYIEKPFIGLGRSVRRRIA